jgi:hypothetical protein
MAPTRTRVPLRTLVDGFDNARLRFEAVAGGADDDAKFIASSKWWLGRRPV